MESAAPLCVQINKKPGVVMLMTGFHYSWNNDQVRNGVFSEVVRYDVWPVFAQWKVLDSAQVQDWLFGRTTKVQDFMSVCCMSTIRCWEDVKAGEHLGPVHTARDLGRSGSVFFFLCVDAESATFWKRWRRSVNVMWPEEQETTTGNNNNGVYAAGAAQFI